METHPRGSGDRRTHSRVATLAALLTIPAIGCGIFAPKRACTADPKFALQVIITDSTSGSRSASGATVVARDGSYADSVQLRVGPDFDSFFPALGLERPGLYTLSVRKGGYKDWIRNGIRVNSGNCGVERVNVTVLLQRATP